MRDQPTFRPPLWRLPTTEIDRRRTLAGFVGILGAGFMPLRAAAQAGTCVLTPDAGEGPFYFDPELVRSDITEGAPGAPLELTLRVVRVGDCATLDGARVDVWHADALGLYSGYARQPGTGEPLPSVEGRTFLRGTQFTSSDGEVVFRTIYPSWYGGRTPHVHFKVFLGGDEVVASQLFFPDDVNDEVFSEWEPYRERRERRRTFNSNDSFLRDGRVEGAFCDVERVEEGFRAHVTVAVRQG